MVKTATMADSYRTLLERNKLFRNISLGSVEHILKGCQVVTLKSGATLLEVGQKNTSLYLVLDGELRVYLNGRGMREAAKLGFTQAIIPKANAPKHKIAGMDIIAVERVEEAVNRVR